jgi:hypothetical protein
MKTIDADLLAAQINGYPAYHVKQPYIDCVFHLGSSSYDYSYIPNASTNRITALQHKEVFSNSPTETATIVLRNNDLLVPNLSGYYVDLQYGLKTSAGNKSEAVNRLWVIGQQEVSKSKILSGKADLKVYVSLQGGWDVLFEQLCLIGNPPFYRDESGVLRDKTVYECLEYLIETTLSLATADTWTLDALAVDDGVINTLVPWPTGADWDFINANSLGSDTENAGFESIGDVIMRLMGMTNCYLRVLPGMHFEVVYPQSTDAVDETYYSSLADGHVFYENTETKTYTRPNHIIVFGNDADEWANYVQGDAYSTDYDNMPYAVIGIETATALTTESECDKLAKAYLDKYKSAAFSGRTVVPMDFRVELFDKIAVLDARGS